MKRVYFIRHGETDGNVGRFYQSGETKLTEAGEAGAKAVAERISHLPVDLIVASHFTRAQQTASYITEATGKPLETFEDVHEVLNATSVWGKGRDDEETADYGAERKAKFTDPNWGPDGAENLQAVLKRIVSTIDYLENRPEENIVVVSHGNFLKHLTSYLLTQKSEDTETHMLVYLSLGSIFNVAITEFVYEEGGWKLSTWNDQAHFAE